MFSFGFIFTASACLKLSQLFQIFCAFYQKQELSQSLQHSSYHPVKQPLIIRGLWEFWMLLKISGTYKQSFCLKTPNTIPTLEIYTSMQMSFMQTQAFSINATYFCCSFSLYILKQKNNQHRKHYQEEIKSQSTQLHSKKQKFVNS